MNLHEFSKSRRAAVGGALALLLCAILVGLWWLQATAPPVPIETIRIGLPLQPSSALLIIALERGEFAARGLQPEITEFPSGKRALHEGLLAGKLDLTTCADVPVALAAFEPNAFRIAAVVFEDGNVNRVVADRRKGIRAPADLKGKRIATQRASAVHYFLHAFLIDNELVENDLSLSFLEAEELAPALAAGTIDAFSMREPYISQARRALGDAAVVFAPPMDFAQYELLLVTHPLAMERQARVVRALAALIAAEDFARRQPQEAIALVARRLGVAPDTIAASWAGPRLRVSLRQGVLLQLEHVADWALQQHLTDGEKIPDFLDLLDLAPLVSLAPDRVTVIR